MLKKRIGKRDLPTQMIWYLVVGGAAFAVDFMVFLALVGVNLAFATIVGYLAGTAANYVLSLWLAFSGGRHRRWSEVARFLAVCLVGLGLTLALVLLLDHLGTGEVMAKIVATILVFLWNYLGRRLFVFGREMPQETWLLSNRVADTLGGERHDAG